MPPPPPSSPCHPACGRCTEIEKSSFFSFPWLRVLSLPWPLRSLSKSWIFNEYLIRLARCWPIGNNTTSPFNSVVYTLSGRGKRFAQIETHVMCILFVSGKKAAEWELFMLKVAEKLTVLKLLWDQGEGGGGQIRALGKSPRPAPATYVRHPIGVTGRVFVLAAATAAAAHQSEGYGNKPRNIPLFAELQKQTGISDPLMCFPKVSGFCRTTCFFPKPILPVFLICEPECCVLRWGLFRTLEIHAIVWYMFHVNGSSSFRPLIACC